MRSLFGAVCFFLFALTAFAQGDRGSITGTLVDQQGAVIAGAPVEARNVENGTLYQAATTATGGGSPIPNEFWTTATPISAQTGTKAYCAFDDGVVRTQPAGTITLVGGYVACQGLLPMAN